MKALVFAAGLGTRLGDFTKEHPKALVDVDGTPMLARVLLKLRDAGITDVTVNVYHFAQQIKDYLAANGNFGMNLHVSDETGMLLETGGGMLAAARYLDSDEPVVVHNADILTDFPLAEMIARHRATGADATLLVAERDTARYIMFAPDGRMDGWTNISTGQCRPDGFMPQRGMLRRAFGGVHVVSPRIFSALASYNDALVDAGATADAHGVSRFSIMDFYIDCCRELQLHAYEPSQPYRWCDIGKPDSLARARELFGKNGNATGDL